MTLFYKVSRLCLKGLFKLAYSHEVYLPEGLSVPQGAIIAANHASFLDPPLIAVSWPEPIHFLARKTLFDVPLLNPIITGLNAHPLGTTSETSSLKLACRLLEEGKKILIFPEGTRSTDGEISPFKQGIGMLARRSGSAIIPAYIHGSHSAWPKHKKFPALFRAKTACVFGMPIYLEEFGNLEAKELQFKIASRLQEEIFSLKEFYKKSIQSKAL